MKSADKQFLITQNGFIKVRTGNETASYFYHPGDEKIWLDAGYTQFFN